MSEVRALIMFEDLPPHHKAVQVRQAGFEPHLKLGEFVVVDTASKEVVNGELYMIWNSVGGGRKELSILQAFAREYDNDKGHHVGVGGRYALLRPGYLAYGEGPLSLEYWYGQKCFGRIVGIYEPMMTELHVEASLIPNSILGNQARRI